VASLVRGAIRRAASSVRGTLFGLSNSYRSLLVDNPSCEFEQDRVCGQFGATLRLALVNGAGLRNYRLPLDGMTNWNSNCGRRLRKLR
jgi:hypothetical protein